MIRFLILSLCTFLSQNASADLSFSPAKIEFGGVNTSDVAVQTVTVTSSERTGDLEVSVGGCVGFEIGRNSCETLKPDQSCRFEIYFIPRFARSYNCTIYVIDGSAAYSRLDVSGEGL